MLWQPPQKRILLPGDSGNCALCGPILRPSDERRDWGKVWRDPPGSASCCNCATHATIRKLDSSGNILWSYDTGVGTEVRDAKFGNSGFVYFHNSSGPSVNKLSDPGLAISWTYNTNVVASVINGQSLEVSVPDGNVYFVSTVLSGGVNVQTLAALSFAGALNWTTPAIETGTVSGSSLIARDSGNVWFSTLTQSSPRQFIIGKINPATGASLSTSLTDPQGGITDDGTNIWIALSPPSAFPGNTHIHENSTFGFLSGFSSGASSNSACDLDSAGNLSLLTNANVKNYTTVGVLNWSTAASSFFTHLRCDSSGNTFVGDGNTVRKLDNTGAQVWAFNHGAQVDCVDIDGSGNVLLSGQRA